MIHERAVSFQYNAPYYTRNQLTAATKRVWLVFHGYGQLSRFFIRKFDQLNPEENFIVAPQGLNKAYLDGFAGRVGANWMTKENRLVDIANQYSYIDAVLTDAQVLPDKFEFVYFGFSQGVSTMCRYAAYSLLSFSKMVLWAGSFPPELEREHFSFLKGTEKILYYTGTEDPFLEPGKIDALASKVSSVMNIQPEITTFSGKHELIPELIGKI